MSIKRVLASSVVAGCTVLTVVAAPTTAQAATQPSLPQVSSARSGANWLAGQFTSEGYIASSTMPGSPDLSATANAVFALASTGVDPGGAAKALSYLKDHVDSYVSQDGADGPGQLALLILDAHALRVSPTSFGGTDLVSRLLATERKTGKNAGMFGTRSQLNDYLVGVYDQGLALASLAAAGVRSGSQINAADSWLEHQQCPDGGWTTYEEPSNPCNGSPADYEGPDTNSTSLAVQGLSAQGVLGPYATKALDWITRAEDGDGGWGYEPNTSATPGSTDPDSTALVIQAILALGVSPTGSSFDKKGTNPVSELESFQSTSGSGKGAFTFPGLSGANTIATYQAVPAVADVFFPLDLEVVTTSLPAGGVGHAYRAVVSASGGDTPYTWAILKGSGGLPAGLALNEKTGHISGTPRTAATSRFVVEVVGAKTTTSPKVSDVAWRVLSIKT